MSRRKQPYLEALKDALLDVERLDFMERYKGTISIVSEGYYFSGQSADFVLAHCGYAETPRGAIDKAMEVVRVRKQELARWGLVEKRFQKLAKPKPAT